MRRRDNIVKMPRLGTDRCHLRNCGLQNITYAQIEISKVASITTMNVWPSSWRRGWLALRVPNNKSTESGESKTLPRLRPNLNVHNLCASPHLFRQRSSRDNTRTRARGHWLINGSVWYRNVLKVILSDSLDGVCVCETHNQQPNPLPQNKENNKQIEAVSATMAAPVNTFLTRNGRRALTNAGPCV